MDRSQQLSVDRIDELVAEKVRGVGRARVVGEFLASAAADLDLRSGADGHRSPRADRHELWIGKFLQFSQKQPAVLKEYDLVATGSQLRRMQAWSLKRWDKRIPELDGVDVDLEVEPVIGYDGRLRLKVHRILEVAGTGCWTRARSSERRRAGSPRRSEERESRIQLRQVPSKITVIAPRRGRASRSDLHRILTTSSALAGIEVAWSTDTGFTGKHASRDIARAVRDAGTAGGLVLLARGGGSRADFWPFETAEVAEAIRACESRVITALGHEEDRCLADDVAFRSFAVPRAAADGIVAACADLARGQQRPTPRGRARRSADASTIQMLEVQLLNARSEQESAASRCRSLESDLVAARGVSRAAIAARDAAQAELGRTILRSLERDAGRTAIRDMRDAVHLRYFSAFPAALTLFYGGACITGAEGAHQGVWAGCALLFSGAVVAFHVAARHLARAARAAVTRAS